MLRLLTLLIAPLLLTACASQDEPSSYAASSPATAPASPDAGAPPAASGDASEPVDLSGTRTMCLTYDQTSEPSLQGLMLCYMLEMEQRADGTLQGTGYRYYEVEAGTEGRDLPPEEQTEIEVTGSVGAGTVEIQYAEQGVQLSTNSTARFDATQTTVDPNSGNPEYPGTFRTDAAGASGPARFVAIPLRD